MMSKIIEKQLIDNSLYLEDWAVAWDNKLVENPFEAMKSDFENYDGKSIRDDIEIIVAYYSYEDYSGDALVIYKENGKLYEVTGGHCSCYGLEGQWEPEEINKEYILHKINEGRWLYYEVEVNKIINNHLIKVLNLKENDNE